MGRYGGEGKGIARTEEGVTFEGPLFILGMSRSGTKLIMALLNRHPSIGIPDWEFHFIARYAYECGKQNWRPDRRWRRSILRTYLNRIGEWGKLNASLKDEGEIAHVVMDTNNSYQDIVKYLMSVTAAIPFGKSGFIWGEKTPTNLNHVKILTEAFPSAKFLHIIRDPRDRALSVRNAWGGNIFMVSEKWRKSVGYADKESMMMKDDFFTIRYEDLLESPRSVLESVCSFLKIPFCKGMLTLESPVERLGDPGDATRTKSEIVPNNTKKFLIELSPDEIRRIDEIVYPVAQKFGYKPINSDIEYIPLSIREKISIPDFGRCK